MLYFRFIDGNVTEVTSKHNEAQGPEWINRWDFSDMEHAEDIANAVSELTDETYIAVDSGPWVHPRYDVIKAPTIGDEVSYAFNGDYYPSGTITKISKTLKKIETSTGKTFYRRKNTAQWLNNGMWSMVSGHINRRNMEL